MENHSRLESAWAAIIILVIALLVALAGCSRGATSPGPSAKGPATQAGPGLADISVRSSSVAFGPLSALHKASGTVKPVMQSQVASQVGGVVSKVLLKAGDWAAEGGSSSSSTTANSSSRYPHFQRFSEKHIAK